MKIFLIGIVAAFYSLLLQGQDRAISGKEAFYCPPCNSSCDQLSFEKAGTCTHCGMVLVRQTAEQRKQSMNRKKITIAFYLQDGVEVLDFAGPMEVFSYAGFEVFTVSKTKEPILSQGILKVIPEYDINDAPKADILAFFLVAMGRRHRTMKKWLPGWKNKHPIIIFRCAPVLSFSAMPGFSII